MAAKKASPKKTKLYKHSLPSGEPDASSSTGPTTAGSNKASRFEPLVTDMDIRLFGDPRPDVVVDPQRLGTLSAKRDRTLAADKPGGKKSKDKVAKIYAYSYRGTFYQLSQPTLFLVRGDGESIMSLSPQDLGALDKDFVDEMINAQFKMWRCDTDEFSLRIDLQ